MEHFTDFIKLKIVWVFAFFILLTEIHESLSLSDCAPIANTIDRIKCTGPNLKNIPTSAKALIVSGTLSKRIALHRLRRSDFTGLNLIEIFITFTELTDIDEDSFQDLKQLRRVILKNNRIVKISQGTFQGLDSLEVVDLSDNEYCEIDSGTFSGLKTLRHLYLGNMKLRSLEKATFQGLQSLIVLDLHGNSLQHIQKDVISSLPKLQSLDLSSNIFKTLPKVLKSTLSRLNHLALSDNPWQCNCDLEWLKELTNLTASRNLFRHAMDYSDLAVCYGPDKLRYRLLIDVPKSEMICIPPKIITCGDPYQVAEGSSLIIHCQTEGDPFPKFTWQSPSGLTIDTTKHTDGYIATDNGTLVVSAADVASDGQWSVSAVNSRGNDSKSFQVGVLLSTTLKTTELTMKTAEPSTMKSMDATTITVKAGEKEQKACDPMMLIAVGAGSGGGVFVILIMTVAYFLYRQSHNKVSPSRKKHDKGKRANVAYKR
ncbi:immunoglobulin superfamily member 10-like [Gigantopelta aegis]|uniref:immunoglobulin superfamily member 10-like n=1 Tax=Gigantopelta aegis TaxID=1735272 RepID=UPI001B887E48|nr:immunoglobulin superfamily member 10-like [Gigantopelta aegis]